MKIQIIQARLRVILHDEGELRLHIDEPGLSLTIPLQPQKALELADALTNGAFSILFETGGDGPTASDQEEAE
jgi:hypothetical protein